MNEPLEILEIVSQPWQWTPELDGVPTRGAGRFVQPAGHGLQDHDADWNPGLRHLSYAFASSSPDVLYDRMAVDLGQLMAVIADVEAAVFERIGGQSGGHSALRHAGESLARLIMPAWVIERLGALPEGAPLVLRPDELAAAIPYELCYAPAWNGFLGRRLAVARGVACRRRDGLSHRQSPASAAGALSLTEGAVVLNPEGDPRLATLAESVSDALDTIPVDAAHCLALHAEASFPELLSALGVPWLLYTGHIRQDDDGAACIVCRDGHHLRAPDVADLLAAGARPRFLALNGCGGDRAALDPASGAAAAGRVGFARAFYEAGVDIVIGSRWEIDTQTACALNAHLLRALTDCTAMPVGDVLRRFRLEDAPGWPGYTLYGDPRWIPRLAPGTSATAGVAASHKTHTPLTAPADKTGPAPAAAESLEILPSRNAPWTIALLLDTVAAGTPPERELCRRFLSAFSAELTNLDARLAPHGGGSAARVFAAGWPLPLPKPGQLTPRALRDLLRPSPPPGAASPPPDEGGPGPALARLIDALPRPRKPHAAPAPRPLIVLLLGSGVAERVRPDDPAGAAAQWVLLCDDLRAGAPAAFCCPPRIWPIALGESVPHELLLTLAGGDRNRTARISQRDEAGAVVTRLFAPLERAYLARARGRSARATHVTPPPTKRGPTR